MEVILNEIKKNRQGTNNGGDEAKSQINDLEHKEEKNTQSENKKKKEVKKKNEDNKSVRCRVQNTGYQDAQKLIGYFNSIKKTQAEMKVTLSEIKKNLQGINSRMDEAESQINDLEHKEEKNAQSEQQE